MGVGAGLYMYDIIAKKFMFTISSPDEFSVLTMTILRYRLPCITYVAVCERELKNI